MKADPKKVHAISNLPRPINKTNLQIFFGMLNYLGNFVANTQTLKFFNENLPVKITCDA